MTWANTSRSVLAIELWRDTVRRRPGEGLLIKRQGDYPAFWSKDASFIATMEEIYQRVRTKSSELK